MAQMFTTNGAAVYTLGVGDLYLENILRALISREVEFLIDVRSPPYAIDRPELFPQELSKALAVNDIRYLDLSANLGDRPRDISLHTSLQRIDYRRYLKRRYASDGLSRIALAYTIGCRVCVLGREADPVRSHQGRLIGHGLYERGIMARHISYMGSSMMSHEQLLRQIDGMNDSVHFSPERR